MKEYTDEEWENIQKYLWQEGGPQTPTFFKWMYAVVGCWCLAVLLLLIL